jgi:hypothetical protein
MKINWKVTAGVVGFLILASGGRTQEVEHAPTAEQCRADQAVWADKLEAPAKDWADSVQESSRIVVAWVTEMNTCLVVDRERIDDYNHTSQMGLLVVGSRKADFIRRHNLVSQFISEDDAGLR